MKTNFRYPGARPFEPDQQDRFFGRGFDKDALLRDIWLENLVVLYAKSGLGKSSLLNAGIIPDVLADGDFFPVRVRFEVYTGEAQILPVDRTCRLIFPKGLPATTLDSLVGEDESLWRYVKSFQFYQASRGGDMLQQETATPEEADFPAFPKKASGLLLLFDQFEELFTYPPEAIDKFQKELARALYTDIPQEYTRKLEKQFQENNVHFSDSEIQLLQTPNRLKAVIAIRSDRFHQLDQISGNLPGVLRHCYELKPLGESQARDAIQKPALLKNQDFSSPSFQYSEAAVKKMLDYLTKDGKEHIESFQLQLLCQSIERKIKEKGQTITEKQLGDIGDLFQNYYEDQLQQLNPASERATARKLMEEDLILEEEERRLSLYQGAILVKYGISAETLNALVNSHLLRAEPNLQGGGWNYELSHDSLVEPILKAKKIRLEKQGARGGTGPGDPSGQKTGSDNRWIWSRHTVLLSLLVLVLSVGLGITGILLSKYKNASKEMVGKAIANVESSILHLDYDKALIQLTQIEPLPGQEERIVQLFMEIAFYKGEAGYLTQALPVAEQAGEMAGKKQVRSLLEKARQTPDSGRSFFLQALEQIDPAHFQFLNNRYYPEMIPVAGGVFTMGCDSLKDYDCNVDEFPVRAVQVSDFKLARTETTVWQYFLYCKATQQEPASPWAIQGDLPMTMVNWFDAVNYCDWLSKRSGEHFRLPREAEWEFAARGGKEQYNFLYAGSDTLEKVGWFVENSNINNPGQIWPVASNRPNTLGLYDMSGNVWEWCQDWYGPYPDIRETNPAGPEEGVFRVFRGGAWLSPAILCRVSFRNKIEPVYGSYSIGFRVAG